MWVLFVHGMGRFPASGWPLLHRLRRAGLRTRSFAYSATFESFDAIVARLTKKLVLLGKAGDYVVVGHSLGGVLLRAALSTLPKGAALPRHSFLLGSPTNAPRLAKRLRRNWVFRTVAGDCGQVLGSPERMEKIGPRVGFSTGIAGVRGITGRYGPFGMDANDGVVSVSEVSAAWFLYQFQLPVVHTLLPSSMLVADIILQMLNKPPEPME